MLIGLDEFQPTIPWQVALQQSLPLLRRLATILRNRTSPYNDFSANGDSPLNFVSQPKGAVQRPLGTGNEEAEREPNRKGREDRGSRAEGRRWLEANAFQGLSTLLRMK